ncbi:MAG TPA: aminoacyl-tRNA hydrolase [Deltaproteobacteria bacterium]|nr:aminoacyl-tRNA hydrolase [Deltaproteobacteria bacterium]
MRLVVGLGNPGSGYVLTRHNLGALILEELAEEASVPISRKGQGARYGTGTIGQEWVMLARPETYMNLSGMSVGKLSRYFGIAAPDIIVIHDDLDLSFGEIRIKEGGGDGGHKGLMSIIEQLGSPDFVRVRAGIGRPGSKEMVEAHVLGRLTDVEMQEMPRIRERGVEAVRAVLLSGAEKAMNEFNVKRVKNSCKEV